MLSVVAGLKYTEVFELISKKMIGLFHTRRSVIYALVFGTYFFDMIVANDVTAPGAGFDVDTNIVTFVTKEETISLPMLKKSEVADRILDQIQAIRKK
jgi:di/tricarboxylate transporter